MSKSARSMPEGAKYCVPVLSFADCADHGDGSNKLRSCLAGAILWHQAHVHGCNSGGGDCCGLWHCLCILDYA